MSRWSPGPRNPFPLPPPPSSELPLMRLLGIMPQRQGRRRTLAHLEHLNKGDAEVEVRGVAEPKRARIEEANGDDRPEVSRRKAGVSEEFRCYEGPEQGSLGPKGGAEATAASSSERCHQNQKAERGENSLDERLVVHLFAGIHRAALDQRKRDG